MIAERGAGAKRPWRGKKNSKDEGLMLVYRGRRSQENRREMPMEKVISVLDGIHPLQQRQ
jgi:hypothetical protein